MAKEPSTSAISLVGSATSPVERSTIFMAVGAATIGNVIEWFDYVAYSYVATAIAHNFFPKFSSTAGLISTFGILALASVVRPLGALVFGPMGDRIGRRKVLAITILLMSVSTAVIGVLPTFGQIGLAAPILLVICRLVQGLSTGGEYSGATTFIAEYSPVGRRGFYCSLLSVGTRLGFLAAAGLVTLLTFLLGSAQFNSWGWRIPFLVALPLGLVGLYLRSRLDETPEFAQVQRQGQVAAAPLRQTFTNAWSRMVLLVLALVIMQVGSYAVLTYLPTYLTSVQKLDAGRALLVTDVLIVLALVLIPIAGWLSDRWGREPVLVAACAGFVVASYPAFMLIAHKGTWSVLLGAALLGICLDVVLGASPAIIAEVFPTRLRSGGTALSYNVSVAIFGGLTPVVLTALLAATGNAYIPAYYLIVAGLISVLPTLRLPLPRPQAKLN